MRKTVDGFPIQKGEVNWFAEEIDPNANAWSFGKTTKIEVWYVDYYYNLIHGKYARNVTWKGETVRVIDYDWFLSQIKQRVEDKFFPVSKEQALDDWFEMNKYIVVDE